ncbi:MAG: TIGR00300 family protein [Verrucomicrobia bacterium]|nr:TIGR00300 family protein [Verrucomicrobiota bacterium]
MPDLTRTLEANGHLIDSGMMAAIMDAVILGGGDFEIVDFDIGRTNEDPSRLVIKVSAPNEGHLDRLLGELHRLGCFAAEPPDATLKPAEADGTVPPDFYSTTNAATTVRVNGQWIEAAKQRMDSAIVVVDGRPECRLLRAVKAGDLVVCGYDGVRIVPEFKARDRHEFSFMSAEISSERKVEIAVRDLATMMRQIVERKGKVVVVAGPVVVHTGGSEDLGALIRNGYVHALLGGNAIAVHDIEYALYGTSLGVNLTTGRPVDAGHRNHMMAINAVRAAGGIKKAVESGQIKSGIMYECVVNNVPFVLAGSLRDDGPLPETMMDLLAAQAAYAKAIEGADLVLMLASMLHSIATGNMLPSCVTTVCVDINPAVVTKLNDRGSGQALGIVTDVGLFLNLLAQELE